MSDDSISLSARYSRALSAASSLSNYSALSDEYKSISSGALTDLKLVSTAINDLQLFSKNETLEDISTRQLVFLSVPYATGELLLSLPAPDPTLRQDVLVQAESELQKFISYVVDYGVVDEAVIQGINKSAQMMNNPAMRREVKIQQYQAEKQLKSQIQALRSRSLSASVDEPSNNYDALRMLLPTPSQKTGTVNQDEDDDLDLDDETTRELSILLLRLLFTQAHTSLLTLSQELQLLRSLPSNPTSTSEPASAPPQDNTWRLDQPRGGPDGRGPLMDPQGKPLRPFTIMPSRQMVDRTRLQQEVFRPDHRLPTMTIDEYLAEEERRGNIITGGGKASQEAPTSSEQLTVDSEQDGTVFGDEKTEEKRIKDEEWAAYTDANPKGMGNTMNRG
ncbi:hypothetical protein BDV93DRAFT_477909 [Ceratobasidium sp. AG-I]|nr:hypothetical protein BDV93DRAFT_477909 [Ceratobasidium sp. AG-I]